MVFFCFLFFAFLTIQATSNNSDLQSVYLIGAGVSFSLLLYALSCMQALYMVIYLRKHSQLTLFFITLLFFNLSLYLTSQGQLSLSS